MGQKKSVRREAWDTLVEIIENKEADPIARAIAAFGILQTEKVPSLQGDGASSPNLDEGRKRNFNLDL